MARRLSITIAWALPVCLIVAACGASATETTVHETNSPLASAAPAGFRMSDSDAVDAALGEAGHIVQDGEIASKSAEAMLWDEAIGRVGGPAAVEREGDTRVWLVTLRGVFTPPGGPVQYTDAKPVVPICSEIRTIIDDETGKSLLLISRPADSC